MSAPVTASYAPVASATPISAAIPTATPTPVAVTTVVSQPGTVDPTLTQQLTHVDPLVWASIASVLVIPFIHELIKKFVARLHDPRHARTNYVIAAVLSLLVGLLTDLQKSGVLSSLHNPVLGTILSGGLSFLLGQQVYGFFIKSDTAAKTTDQLPTVSEV